MTERNHDHPGSPDGTHGIDPADLDLYALDALPGPETDALEEALVNAPEDQRASMLAHIAATREVAADMVAGAGLDASPPPALRARVLDEVAPMRAVRARVDLESLTTRTTPLTPPPVTGQTAAARLSI